MNVYENGFYEWVSSRVTPKQLSDYYFRIADIDNYAHSKRLYRGSFFDVASEETLNKLLSALKNEKNYQNSRNRTFSELVDIVVFYINFIAENNIDGEVVNSTKFQNVPDEKDPPTSVGGSVSCCFEDSYGSYTGNTPAECLSAYLEALYGRHKQQVPPNMRVEDNVNAESATRLATYFATRMGEKAAPVFHEVSVQAKANGIKRSTNEDYGTPGICTVNFNSDINLTHSKPVSASYFDEEIIETSWRKLYLGTCLLLYKDYPHVFKKLCNKPVKNQSKVIVYSKKAIKRLTSPAELDDGYYVETHRSATELVKNIKILLDECNVDYENLVIKYRQTDLMEGDEVPGMPKNEISVTPDDDSTEWIIKRLTELHLTFSDQRENNGFLWVVGGDELVDFSKECKEHGYRLLYRPYGCKTYPHESVWWTKNKPTPYTKAQPQNNNDSDIISHSAPETPYQTSPVLEDSLLSLLQDDRYTTLRNALKKNNIVTLEEFKRLNLWAFMNRNNLYSIGERQRICLELRNLLKARNTDNKPSALNLWKIITSNNEYSGTSPSDALLEYCRALANKFPLQFRDQVGRRISGTSYPLLNRTPIHDNDLNMGNPDVYLDGSLSAEKVLISAKWISIMCKDDDPPLRITCDDNSSSEDPTKPITKKGDVDPRTPQVSDTHSTHTTEKEESKDEKHKDFPVASSSLQHQVEELVMSADLDGMTLNQLSTKIPSASMVSLKHVRETSPSIVDIRDRLIHVDSFIDFEEGADQLEKLLDKLMHKNDGYVSSSQLYEYAKAEMTLFLNDNNINDERAVYDLAQHLFEKVIYHGKQYKFSGKAHISNFADDISSNLDVYKKYAANQGGIFSYSELVEYLGSMGLGTGNLRAQMRVYSEPIFLCYETGVFIYTDFMNIDTTWQSEMKKALSELLTEAGGHIILRDLPEEWLARLPSLPQNRSWTPLLLQSVLRWYSKELGARTISAMEGQAADTLHTMLVTIDNPIQSFGDVVIAWLVETENEQRDFEAEELRRNLADAGIIQGNELLWNMPKALKDDERFAWDATGSHVKVEVR